jgi:hypothetical protein
MAVALFLGLLPIFLPEFLRISRRRLGLEEPSKAESHSERLASLMESLTRASSEVDGILTELAQMADDREKTLQDLGARLSELEQRELQLQKRIQHLQKVPLSVADYFAEIVAQGEKRSALRDYILFGLGVLASVVVGIVFNLQSRIPIPAAHRGLGKCRRRNRVQPSWSWVSSQND